MQPPDTPRPRSRRRLIGAIAATAALVTTGLTTISDSASAHGTIEAHTITDVAYTDPVPETTRGNLLDIYVPEVRHRKQKLPLLIWTSGSAWFSDEGKAGAAPIAAEFNPRGYVVAGVSVRSSAQVEFPGQLHDVRAAVRWLRKHAHDYNIDPKRIAIMGNSSGGWVSAITATTSDIRRLPGEPRDAKRVSSAVQAAVPFFPPTDFLQMDAQTVVQKETYGLDFLPVIVHDAPGSPESQLIGCPIQECPDDTALANPIRYASRKDPPVHVFHGTFDPLLPPGQSRGLFDALRKVGADPTFTLVDGAGHSVDDIVDAESYTVYSTTRRNKVREGQHPAPTWDAIDDFLQRSLRTHGRGHWHR